MAEVMNIDIREIYDAIHRGDLRFAMWVMRHLSPELENLFRDSDDPAVRLCYLRAKAMTYRALEIYRPCPILGPAGPTLRPRQRAMIETILTNHWMSWQRGNTPEPVCRNVFKRSEGEEELRGDDAKVAIVFGRHIHSNPLYIESDFYVHFNKSCKDYGCDVYAYNADDITYSQEIKNKNNICINKSLDELSNFLEKVRPDIVVTDGNFSPSKDTINSKYWMEKKELLKFKLAICVGDSYDDSCNIQEWLDCSDVVITMNETSLQTYGKRNVMTIPSIPLSESLLKESDSKDIPISCIGSANRNRDAWLRPFQALGVKIFASLHDRTKENAPNSEKYRDIMGRSKIIFNNGVVSPLVHIQTGRFYEAIMSKAVVLEEVGSPAYKYFSEYVHYIPVANIDQAISFSQFLLENEDWRSMIANSAKDYWNKYYATTLFWESLIRRLK
nr:hypothetical protein [Azospirillum thiophilum]